MGRRDGTPLWIDLDARKSAIMQRAELQRDSASDGYSEAWLQRLLDAHPEVLPIHQIEPGFGPLISICRELPLSFGGGRSGALDNFFMTPEGGLALVEAKLWRNPEARREVVAQAMEYAAALFRLSYDELEAAVRLARADEPDARASLYELVGAADAGVEEAEFADAVMRNLARGRAIVAVVGDGIREDILPLAALLQTHAGSRFTFALVELAVFEGPDRSVRIVHPSVLAQTVLIERGVVQIEDGGRSRDNLSPRIVVRDPPPPPRGVSRGRAFGVSEDEFFEILGQRDRQAPEYLKRLLARIDGIGVFPDLRGGLSLKHRSPEGPDLNLGTITKDGFVDTAPSSWFGRTAFGKRYNQTLAALISGGVREIKNDTESAVRTAAMKTPRLSDFLPAHEDAWIATMETYIKDVFENARASDN